MISEALRIDIERWVSRRDEQPVFRMAAEGRLTPSMVTRYIANVTYMVRRTIGYLERARDGARLQGNAALVEYYEHKMDEEEGHAVWGEADLRSLSRVASDRASTTPTPAIVALATELDRLIDEEPASYLTYLAFTEYITVLIGPELLSHIEERCGISRASMTIIDNHIELDREHAEEGFGIIDDLVGEPRKLRPLREALSLICARFDEFCKEVVCESSDEFEPHVSAA